MGNILPLKEVSDLDCCIFISSLKGDVRANAGGNAKTAFRKDKSSLRDLIPVLKTLEWRLQSSKKFTDVNSILHASVHELVTER